MEQDPEAAPTAACTTDRLDSDRLRFRTAARTQHEGQSGWQMRGVLHFAQWRVRGIVATAKGSVLRASGSQNAPAHGV